MGGKGLLIRISNKKAPNILGEIGISFSLEATTGFEPVIRVLQTLAFPLGHVAIFDFRFMI